MVVGPVPDDGDNGASFGYVFLTKTSPSLAGQKRWLLRRVAVDSDGRDLQALNRTDCTMYVACEWRAQKSVNVCFRPGL